MITLIEARSVTAADRVMVTFVANFQRDDRSGEYEVLGRDGLLLSAVW